MSATGIESLSSLRGTAPRVLDDGVRTRGRRRRPLPDGAGVV